MTQKDGKETYTCDLTKMIHKIKKEDKNCTCLISSKEFSIILSNLMSNFFFDRERKIEPLKESLITFTYYVGLKYKVELLEASIYYIKSNYKIEPFRDSLYYKIEPFKDSLYYIELNNKIESLRDSLYYIEYKPLYRYIGAIKLESYYGFFNDLDKIKSEIINIRYTYHYAKIIKYRMLKNNHYSEDFSHPEFCYQPSPLTKALLPSPERATISLAPQLNDDVIKLINDFTGLDYLFVITDEERSEKIPRAILNDQNIPEDKEVHRVILNKLSNRRSRLTYQPFMGTLPRSWYHSHQYYRSMNQAI